MTSVLPRTRPGIERHARRFPWRRSGALALAFAFAALAFALLHLAHHRDQATLQAGGDVLAIKGGPALQVFARHGGQVFPVHEGSLLAPGDAIRFIVQPASLPYLLVASVDGAGAITIYYPFGGTTSARLADPKRPFELPGSIVLDTAPGPERVFALFSQQPLASSDVVPALRAIASRGAAAIRATPRLALPSAAQASLCFEKPAAESP